jgi:hypothetical protein
MTDSDVLSCTHPYTVCHRMRPVSVAGDRWMGANLMIDEDNIIDGDGWLIVEGRFLQDILDHMTEEGLVIMRQFYDLVRGK